MGFTVGLYNSWVNYLYIDTILYQILDATSFHVYSLFCNSEAFSDKEYSSSTFYNYFLRIIKSTFYLIPTPDIVLSDFYYNLSNSYFQDIYQQDVSNQAQIKMSREDFYGFPNQCGAKKQYEMLRSKS